jgi:hypothetical protein
MFALVPIAQFNTINPNKESTMKYITEKEVPNVLNTINGAEFFSMVYYKKDGSRREATAQLHVSHPRNEAITPNGLGETAKEALASGRIKYYEAHHPGDKEGVYRQCRIDRLDSMKVRGVTYKVIH